MRNMPDAKRSRILIGGVAFYRHCPIASAWESEKAGSLVATAQAEDGRFVSWRAVTPDEEILGPFTSRYTAGLTLARRARERARRAARKRGK